MQKNKKLTIALPVLLGVMILVWLPNLFPSASKKGGKKSRAVKESFTAHDEAVVLVKKFTASTSSAKTATPWGERDPFINKIDIRVEDSKPDKTKVKSTVAAYVLSGIFWNEQKPSAIINDSVVEIGSAVGSVIVKEISSEKVVLLDGIREVVLVLRKNT